MVARVKAELLAFWSSLGSRPLGPLIIFVGGGLSLFSYEYAGSSHFFTHFIARHLFPDLSPRNIEAGSYLYWFGSAFPLLILLPVALARLAGRVDGRSGGGSLGLSAGNWRLGLSLSGLFYAVMLPILFAIVWTSDFQDYYPIYSDADRSLRMFLVYELSYFVYFVAWEFFFRGFLTFTLEPTLGGWVVFVQMLPFMCMHFGKPAAEAASSIAGGLALGWLAIRTRSIWYGVVVHGATAVTLD